MSDATSDWPSTRTAGVLMHPTALPGPYGIGDLGPSARAWVDLLARSGQTWWQVLPLNPPGAGDSPYQAYSAFAGNPLLVSPDDLVAEGLLENRDTAGVNFSRDRVDYSSAEAFKLGLLARSWERFCGGAVPGLRAEFEEFSAAEAHWLDDFALFMAAKDAMPRLDWVEWPRELLGRRPATLQRTRRELADGFDRHRFAQFLFARQLRAVRTHAKARGVRILGDLPIFISPESADLWANPLLFRLDARRRPSVVAGVPPDYFSRTGQRWGNPHYDWEAMRKDNFAWWLARVRATLGQVDAVRLDHFRGFEAYWEIPADCPTAVEGRWVEAPGRELLEAIRTDLGGNLPFVAEDLGVITPEVDALRERFGLPGMRVLQFAFGGAVEDRFLPHGFVRNVVAYTGTHDNDTTRGWYDVLTPAERQTYHRYAPESKLEPVWALIRLAWASVADTAIAPLQDVLGLGTGSRMNVPGTPAGNWRWRVGESELDEAAFDRLGELTETYCRDVKTPRSPGPLSDTEVEEPSTPHPAHKGGGTR